MKAETHNVLLLAILLTLSACGGGGSGVTDTSTNVSDNGNDVGDAGDTGGDTGNGGDTGTSPVVPTSTLTQIMADHAINKTVLQVDTGSGSSQTTIRDDFSIRVNTSNGRSIVFDDSLLQTEIDTARVYVNGSNGRQLVVDSRVQSSDPQLDYTVFGHWVFSRSNADYFVDNPDFVERGAFVAGSVTPIENMPTSGTARYTGNYLGSEQDRLDGNRYKVAGGGTVLFDVDFLQKNISGSIRGPNITMPSTSIDGNRFSTNEAVRDNGDVGTIEGYFMGPAANEIGGVLDFDGKASLVGAFGATNCGGCPAPF